MGVNPCPCMRPQAATMALAIVDAVLSMISLGLIALGLVYLIKYDSDDLTKSEKTVGIVVLIISAIICILQVLLAFRLYYGAKKSDTRNVRIWIMITTVVLVLNILSWILNISAANLNGSVFGSSLFTTLYKIYELLVVHYFYRELLSKAAGDSADFVPTAYPNPQMVYVTPYTQQAYPMQQYPPPAYSNSPQGPILTGNNPVYPGQEQTQTTTVTNPSYPAPVHRVTPSNRVI